MELIEGMKFDRGYISPYFMNTTKGHSVMLKFTVKSFQTIHKPFVDENEKCLSV